MVDWKDIGKKMFGTSRKKAEEPIKMQEMERRAEEKAYEHEVQRRRDIDFEKRMQKAAARGRAKATPLHEQVGDVLVGTGKTAGAVIDKIGKGIESKQFQRYASAGAQFTGTYPRTYKRKRKSKGKSTKRRSESQYPAIFDMI